MWTWCCVCDRSSRCRAEVWRIMLSCWSCLTAHTHAHTAQHRHIPVPARTRRLWGAVAGGAVSRWLRGHCLLYRRRARYDHPSPNPTTHIHSRILNHSTTQPLNPPIPQSPNIPIPQSPNPSFKQWPRQHPLRPPRAADHAANPPAAGRPHPYAPRPAAVCAKAPSVDGRLRRRAMHSRACRMALQNSATPWPIWSRI